MARPRVFISSTFYDLKQIRSDLEHFIRSMGYEPVMHERGTIPYGRRERLEDECYREIATCEMLVSIVGGRFGSGSQYQPYSISQMELKKALSEGKQVYIFVEHSVLNEYDTYRRNKDKEGVVYARVDDTKVYQFLDEVHALPPNNQIRPFEVASDISEILKEQWAGLFQRSMRDEAHRPEVQAIAQILATAQTLDQLVSYLTEDRRNHDEAIKDILLMNHPLFSALRRHLDVPYRVFFVNHGEMERWLVAVGWGELDDGYWDDPDYEGWITYDADGGRLLRIWTGLFDDEGKLKSLTPEEWQADWVTCGPIPGENAVETDDPFGEQ